MSEAPDIHRTRSFDGLGFGFAVRSADPALRRYLERILAHLAVPGPPQHLYGIDERGHGPRSRVVVSLDGTELRAAGDPATAVGHLLWDLNRRVIEHAGPRHLLLHAAAAGRHDRVVVLPAASEAGKSTLVAGLVDAGLRYVTDEAVAVGLADLLVHPYPKPIDIDPGSWPVLAHLASPDPDLARFETDQWHLAPTAVGTGTVASAAPAGLVVLPSYRPAATTALTPMSRREALVSMAEEAFNFHDHGAEALAALATVVRRCRCYRLSVADLGQACALVLKALDEQAQDGEAGDAVLPAVTAAAGRGTRRRPPGLRPR